MRCPAIRPLNSGTSNKETSGIFNSVLFFTLTEFANGRYGNLRAKEALQVKDKMW